MQDSNDDGKRIAMTSAPWRASGQSRGDDPASLVYRLAFQLRVVAGKRRGMQVPQWELDADLFLQ